MICASRNCNDCVFDVTLLNIEVYAWLIYLLYYFIEKRKEEGTTENANEERKGMF